LSRGQQRPSNSRQENTHPRRILFIAILAILQRDRRSRAKEKLERDAVMALFSADRRSF
jgi:hypothetical protein